MSKINLKSSEEDYFYLNIHNYLGLDLDKSNSEKMDSIISKGDFKKKLDAYKHAKFQIETSISKYSLSNQYVSQLKSKVRPEEVSESLQDEELIQIYSKEKSSSIVKNIFLLSFFSLVAYGLYTMAAPKKKSNFRPFESLIYETMVMGSAATREHLDYPTTNLSEISKLFTEKSRINFSPILFSGLKEEWQVVGGSVIDYEVAKIALLQFEKKEWSDEQVFLYSFKGSLDSFTDLKPKQEGAFTYYSYGSEEVNLIAWEDKGRGSIAFLVGWVSTDSLIQIAKSGLKIP